MKSIENPLNCIVKIEMHVQWIFMNTYFTYYTMNHIPYSAIMRQGKYWQIGLSPRIDGEIFGKFVVSNVLPYARKF